VIQEIRVSLSRAVALAFGKRHKNVLRAIEHMRANSRPLIAEHCRLNFEPPLYRVPGPNSLTPPMAGFLLPLYPPIERKAP